MIYYINIIICVGFFVFVKGVIFFVVIYSVVFRISINVFVIIIFIRIWKKEYEE